MLSRILLSILAVAGTLLAVGCCVVLMNLTLYGETSVPPRSDLPDLPDGLTITDESEGCGSGSCYREFTVVGPSGYSATAVLARLAKPGCGRHSLVDWRPLCLDYRVDGDRVRGTVSLGKWLG